mmetsp:Transcript_75555/g.212835  ORF Transcript_75555/g.212835 Transcript_75555/m.212835 type:complete len:291 (-) Transcript_75555:1-873(-)
MDLRRGASRSVPHALLRISDAADQGTTGVDAARQRPSVQHRKLHMHRFDAQVSGSGAVDAVQRDEPVDLLSKHLLDDPNLIARASSVIPFSQAQAEARPGRRQVRQLRRQGQRQGRRGRWPGRRKHARRRRRPAHRRRRLARREGQHLPAQRAEGRRRRTARRRRAGAEGRGFGRGARQRRSRRHRARRQQSCWQQPRRLEAGRTLGRPILLELLALHPLLHVIVNDGRLTTIRLIELVFASLALLPLPLPRLPLVRPRAQHGMKRAEPNPGRACAASADASLGPWATAP